MSRFSSAAPASAADRRIHARDGVNRVAKVIDGAFALNAVVRDISAGGARLAFDDRPPGQGALVVVDLALARAYETEVVWRKGPEVGVRILSSQDLRGLVSARFDRARLIWRAQAG